MGTVLNFHNQARPGRFARRPMQSGRHAPAEIVIFPGVRIERHEAATALDLSARIGRKQEGAGFSGKDRDPGKTH